MKTLQITLIFSLFLVFTNCASSNMPGAVSVSESEFDGTKSVYMKSGDIYGSSGNIRIGLFRSESMPNREVMMTVTIRGLEDFPRNEPSLFFNVDGTIDSLTTVSKSTDYETSEVFANEFAYISPENWSSANYIVSTGYIKRLIYSGSVKIRVATNESYHEGNFSKGGWSTAKDGFKDFLQKLQETDI